MESTAMKNTTQGTDGKGRMCLLQRNEHKAIKNTGKGVPVLEKD